MTNLRRLTKMQTSITFIIFLVTILPSTAENKDEQFMAENKDEQFMAENKDEQFMAENKDEQFMAENKDEQFMAENKDEQFKSGCYAEACEWHQYCNFTSKDCEPCMNKMSECYTPRKDDPCKWFCIKRRPCRPLEELKNGSHNGTSKQKEEFMYNDRVMFHCQIGFVNIGARETVCSDYGFWTHQNLSIKQPYCQAHVYTCPLLNNPSHGRIFYPANITHCGEGTEVNYDCDPGYALTGQAQIHCKASGKWSGTPPECVKMAKQENFDRYFFYISFFVLGCLCCVNLRYE